MRAVNVDATPRKSDGNFSTDASAHDAYATRLAAARAAIEKLDARAGRFANGRTLTFISGSAAFIASIVGYASALTTPLALVSFALYVVLAVRHSRVLEAEAAAQQLRTLNERGLARLRGAWRDFPSRGERHAPSVDDLGLFGTGSLFQRLDETSTISGETRLAELIKAPATSVDELAARQSCIRELSPRLDFRQRLAVRTRSISKADPSLLATWAEAAPKTNRVSFFLAHLLPPFTMATGLLAALDRLPPQPFYALVCLQIALLIWNAPAISASAHVLSESEGVPASFVTAFEAIAAERFTAPPLESLQRRAEGAAPLRELQRLLSFAALKRAAAVHAAVNVLTLWDIHWFFRLDRWRARHAQHCAGWFVALSEFEALASCAGWAFEHPEDPFPTVVDGPVRFVARGLAHPLLDAPVPNDVELPRPGSALIVTGSNMSGKSTLARAIGLARVMACTGLPVRAAALETTLGPTLTAMRVVDSLAQGVSFFQAEALAMRAVLDAVRAAPERALVLCDELFMGTNTQERREASRAVFEAILDMGALGVLTTHDVALCELAQTRGGLVQNVHFEDRLDLSGFDYRLRPGVVSTTNALAILRKLGVIS